MIIEKVAPRRDSFREYALAGSLLTIGDISIDLEEEQEDQEVIIPFSRCAAVIHRGTMSCGEYVAEVVIPPRRYDTIEVVEETTEEGAEQQTHTESVPIPLDTDCVVLKLWPLVTHNDQEQGGL
jgi:hypothetical protein